MRRDRAIVDDATTLRALRLHQPERLLSTQKGASEIDIDHRPPLLEGKLLHRHRARRRPRIVEEEIEATEVRGYFGESRRH